MSESTQLIFNQMSDQKIYSVYEGNLACPMSGLVPEKFVKILNELPGVRAVSPEVRQNTVMLKDFIVTIIGVDPDQFRKFKPLKIAPKIWDEFKNNPRTVLIGKDLAQTIRSRYGQLENRYNIPLNVAGIFDLPMSLLNSTMIAHTDYLKKFLFKGENVTVINLLFEGDASPKVMCESIESRLSGHKSKLVCRPETTIWERAQVGMAQFGKYVRHYALFVLAILFVLNLAQTFLLLRRYSLKNNPLRIRIFSFTTLLGAILGVLSGTVIFFTQPTLTGFDIFNPPVLVNLSVVLKAASSVFLVGFAANLLGIYLFHKSKGKKVSKKCVFTLSVFPVILITFTMNFLLSYPFKLRHDLLGDADRDILTVLQAGTSLRIRQASNIPNTVLEVCRLAPNIDTENGVPLFTPIIQFAANIAHQNIPFIGVNPETFFLIESEINFTKGRKPEKKNEISIGKNVGRKLGRELSIGETLIIEGEPWNIVGIFEADSYYNNFIVAEISKLIAVTGRETLQAVILKLSNIEQAGATINKIQKYYGMLVDELPDLPRLAISSELEQIEQVAANYNGLILLNFGMVILSIYAGYLLFHILSSLVVAANAKPTAFLWKPPFTLVFILTLVIEIISYYLGDMLWFTLVLSSFSLRPQILLMLGSFAAILSIQFIAQKRTNSGNFATVSHQKHTKKRLEIIKRVFIPFK
jgi:ABC-type lipoprotein release transport system permease subunit